MFRIYLINNTVVVKPVDGRGNMFGEVYKDREVALLTYRYLCDDLASRGELCPDSSVIN